MTTSLEHVVLVDEFDRAIGSMEKMEAHRRGELHRAFSVFLFNSKGEFLIHQRAVGKYHSGGLWTNACCSHQRVGESVEAAAVRRLQEEMGMEAELTPAFQFTYRAELDGGLIEHELDHVLVGVSDALPHPNVDEVASYRYVGMEALLEEVAAWPDRFTAWFKVCIPEVVRRQAHRS